MGSTNNGVAIVMVPFPAQGHLNQLLHLSLTLTTIPISGVSIHYAAPAIHIRQTKSRLQGWPAASLNSIHFHDLPIPPFASPPPNPDSPINFPTHLQPLFEAFYQVRPHLASLLKTISAASRRVVVIHDPLASFAGHEAAALPNGESYVFQCVPPSFSIAWHGEYAPATAFLQAHGLTVPSRDGCISEEFWAIAHQHWSEIRPESGLLINSCRLIENDFIEFYVQRPDFPIKDKIFAIGPLNPIEIKQGSGPRHECLEWLDMQPPDSVLYVSFGSTTSMPDVQIEQLAVGLANSGQRFIWVLREADRGDMFLEKDERRERKLPSDFTSKIKGKGFIIDDWAPQLDILAHRSTAAFMSHCGWNSSIESISMGVPILAWPMHSDQPWNAVFVSDYLKVGVKVREWDRRREVVPAADIEEVIKKVMVCSDGEKIRQRSKELGEAVRRAVSDGGSSHVELLSFLALITK